MTSRPRRVVLDANVLFSRVLHDLLGRAGNFSGAVGLYDVFWSEELLRETTDALVERYALPRQAGERAMQFVRDGFPGNAVDISALDASVNLSRYTSDPDDEHVCALAILAEAGILVTGDGGFHRARLRQDYGVRVCRPDEFLVELVVDNGGFFADLVERWAASRQGTTPEELLERIAKAGCEQFAKRVAQLLAGGT